MPSESVKGVTSEDIQQVENLIGQCLRKYMSPKQVVETLLSESKIEPEFTKIVWKKLEEHNAEFFKAYYTRVVLKQQIEQYNILLEKQKEIMDSQQNEVPLPPNSNGSHVSPSNENSESNSDQE
ncbi:uncharacterized protein [Medicago truncatula]|nr:uncharacterized protein LOC25488667 [Medicago truncatula]